MVEYILLASDSTQELVNNVNNHTFFEKDHANIITDPEWEATGGDNPLAKGLLAHALGLKTTSGNPSVGNLRVVFDEVNQFLTGQDSDFEMTQTPKRLTIKNDTITDMVHTSLPLKIIIK